MITFKNHVIFNEMLKNDDFLFALSEAGIFGFGTKETPPEITSGPSKTPVSDEIAQQYRQQLLKDRPRRFSLRNLLGNRSKKDQVLQTLKLFEKDHPILRELIDAIEAELS